MKYFLILSILISSSTIAFAQEGPPETIEEAQRVGEDVLWGLPGALEDVWQEAKIIWGGMFDWIRINTGFWFEDLWYRIKSTITKEVEDRKPEVNEEFEREKEELKEELPKAGKSLWQKFIELIR